jgi:hypothetical protein
MAMRKIILFFAMMISLLQTGNTQNVGIGTTNPTQRLEVNGNIRVTGAIMPGGDAGDTGEVLTSNGPNAAPAWRAPAKGGRFWMPVLSNLNSTSGPLQGRGGWSATSGGVQSDSVDFGTAMISGTDFTINSDGPFNNFITVNRAGLYHFEGGMRYVIVCDAALTLLPVAQVAILLSHPSTGDRTLHMTEEKMDKVSGAETASSQNMYLRFVKFSIDLNLPAGATVTFENGMFNLRFPLAILGIQGGGYFSGQFVGE